MDTDGDVCRMCLDIDVLMFSISGTPLQSVYEKLTNKPLDTGTKPVTACYVCHAQLVRSYNFMLTCSKAEGVLEEILQEKSKVTLKSIALIDCKSKGLQGSLIVTPVNVESFPEIHIVPTTVPGTLVSDSIIPFMDSTSDFPYNSSIGGPAISMDRFVPADPIRDLNQQMLHEEIVIKDEHSDCPKLEDMVEDNTDASVSMQTGEGTHLVEVEVIGAQHSEEMKLTKDENDCSGEKQQQYRRDPTLIGGAKQSKKHTKKQNQDKGNFYGETRHDLNYNSKRKFKCNYCEKRFMRKAYLQNHLVIHTGEKPYECNVCGCRYSRKISLQRHFISHTGEKRHECEVCMKRFGQKSHLDSHMMTHTGEKPYQCDICEKRFSQKTYLRKHRAVHIRWKPPIVVCGRR